uniref:Uncharacterized protein n=1 Tax=Tanacetum cinerariifolium TaxID=118510 RepID=A0A699H321_TANCI|nr:hypothetical protein [Tanacetum cinerariifolium]
MSQINFENVFFDDTDDEAEVNSRDAVGKTGISALVKCTSVIRQLAYGAVPDSLDEYLQISEITSRDCLIAFCNGVMELYDEEFLRRPMQTDVEKLYAFHEEKHGFPGMIGSIDCTKWQWAQFPKAYHAQFRSNNDVNVLRQTPILNDLKVGKAPERVWPPGKHDLRRPSIFNDGGWLGVDVVMGSFSDDQYKCLFWQLGSLETEGMGKVYFSLQCVFCELLFHLKKNLFMYVDHNPRVLVGKKGSLKPASYCTQLYGPIIRGRRFLIIKVERALMLLNEGKWGLKANIGVEERVLLMKSNRTKVQPQRKRVESPRRRGRRRVTNYEILSPSTVWQKCWIEYRSIGGLSSGYIHISDRDWSCQHFKSEHHNHRRCQKSRLSGSMRRMNFDKWGEF